MLGSFLKVVAAVLFVAAGCSGDDGGGGSAASSSGTGGAGGAPTTSSTSTTSTTSSSGGGGGGGLVCSSLGDPCTVCLAAECQESYCRCQQRAECAAAANCFLGCTNGDDECYPECVAVHAAGAAEVMTMGSCELEKCAVQCPYDNGLSMCQRCVFSRCPAEASTCFINPACRALLGCVQACGANLSCRDDCIAANPDGSQEGQAVLGCGSPACDMACQ